MKFTDFGSNFSPKTRRLFCDSGFLAIKDASWIDDPEWDVDLCELHPSRYRCSVPQASKHPAYFIALAFLYPFLSAILACPPIMTELRMLVNNSKRLRHRRMFIKAALKSQDSSAD
ncbi:hypothetical protein SISNIDRAFT_351969 [Sistotremastrum niveocremeum HHB9708]|uniref:Uncharacterized protein n=1 Tax=Sistotremastrum niveocremeum HHB9708 TaxID=1314777 RepID=A0A164X2D1_9AGAM|nr:hypothetical protein SISNIDRAFT_351969 [Sistotremastrum niveocremeum HHB9708]